MKIIILILFIFYSNHSFAESNFNKKENFDLKDSEFEIAWGGIFKKIPKLIKPKKIPRNGKNFKDLKPKIPDDGWYFPNPSVIGPQIARIKRQYEKEYEDDFSEQETVIETVTETVVVAKEEEVVEDDSDKKSKEQLRQHLADEAKRTGVMQAAPGTEQGKTGWYIDSSGELTSWLVTESGEWTRMS